MERGREGSERLNEFISKAEVFQLGGKDAAVI
jgi:hypothetical protein